MTTNALAAPRGRQPSIEYVPVGELLIDDSYQRATDTQASQRLISRIATTWDWDVFDVLKVSRRPDDRLFVIDGQHRLAAAHVRGDIQQLPCVLKRCNGPQEEARLFIESNRGRKAMSRLDDFRAAVGAGNEEAMLIDRLAAKANLTIARRASVKNQAPGELAIIAPIRKALQLRGEKVTGDALQLIGDAFPDETIVGASSLFGALVEILALTEAEFDDLFATLMVGTSQDWSDWAGPTSAVRGGTARVAAMRAAIEARLKAFAPELERAA